MIHHRQTSAPYLGRVGGWCALLAALVLATRAGADDVAMLDRMVTWDFDPTAWAYEVEEVEQKDGVLVARIHRLEMRDPPHVVIDNVSTTLGMTFTVCEGNDQAKPQTLAGWIVGNRKMFAINRGAGRPDKRRLREGATSPTSYLFISEEKDCISIDWGVPVPPRVLTFNAFISRPVSSVQLTERLDLLQAMMRTMAVHGDTIAPALDLVRGPWSKADEHGVFAVLRGR